jgi:hypothetical protein
MTTTVAVATVEPDDTVDIVDFTLPVKRIRFKIDSDIFEAHAALGLPMMQALIKVTKTLGDLGKDGDYSPIIDVFNELLTAESAPRFAQRITGKGADAIDVRRQLIPILYHLLEKYGIRPTQPSSDSSIGLPSGTGGTTSTAGFSTVASG